MPLGQLFVKARGLDVVVAVDGSSDITPTHFPKYGFRPASIDQSKLKSDFVHFSGSSLFFTASRIATLLQSSHQPFPPLPKNVDEFISTGVNMRPTFFGCYPTQNPPEYPIVVYLPNSPPLNGKNPVTK